MPSKVAPNLEWKSMPSKFFGDDSIMNENHFVLRDPARMATMYKAWWNSEMVDRLIIWSKNRMTHPNPHK